MAQLPLIRQNKAANAHIDGATPSYLPPSINQPNQNMPHRSEWSQDRRQNHQERHQSCPFSDIDGATASCLGITIEMHFWTHRKKSGIGMGFKGHRWRNSFSRYGNEILKVFCPVHFFVKICWKMRFLSSKFCPPSVLKPSVVHF